VAALVTWATAPRHQVIELTYFPEKNEGKISNPRSAPFVERASRRRVGKSGIEAIMFNRIRMTALAAAGIAAQASILAQSAPEAAPKFEVASVKASSPDSHGISLSGDPSRFTIRNTTIRFVISLAYDVKDFQISGRSPLLDSERYDIEATIGADTPERPSRLTFATIQSAPQVRLMLQTLLVDRFYLAIRHETKETPGYSLTVAKNGPKLRESTAPEDLHDMSVDLGQIKSNRMSTAQLAGALSRMLGLPVVDKTGLTGFYDLRLIWTPGDPVADAISGPSIFAALQETLGLRLVSSKEPVDILVIEHVEKPSGN
jgi:bla regulator protein BlaR1